MPPTLALTLPKLTLPRSNFNSLELSGIGVGVNVSDTSNSRKPEDLKFELETFFQ
jgi:hypothetical protein